MAGASVDIGPARIAALPGVGFYAASPLWYYCFTAWRAAPLVTYASSSAGPPDRAVVTSSKRRAWPGGSSAYALLQ
eukprot:10302413-Alexandrium_andersonii.AAC.1